MDGNLIERMSKVAKAPLNEDLSSNIAIDKVELEKLRSEAVNRADVDYSEDSLMKEWLITLQQGGSNKYHYYFIMPDGRGWKCHGRVGAKPVVNPINKVKSRTMEQEIEGLVKRKVAGGYVEQDVDAIEKGEAVAKHAGDDPQEQESEITSEIEDAGIVQELKPSRERGSLEYNFTYKGAPGNVYASSNGLFRVKIGDSWRPSEYALMDDEFEDWKDALEELKTVLTDPAELDRLYLRYKKKMDKKSATMSDRGRRSGASRRAKRDAR